MMDIDERSAPAETAAAARPFSDILCGVDGTVGSEAAVDVASHLARGGQLTLLAVTGEVGSGMFAAADLSPGRAEHVLEHDRERLQARGIEVRTELVRDRELLDAILERARSHDLLVLGAPPMSRIGGLMIGGVAVEAMGRFTAPMLLARRSYEGSPAGRPILIASDGQEGSQRVVELAGQLAAAQGAHLTLVHAVGQESKVSHRRIEAQQRELEKRLPDGVSVRVEPGRAADVILRAEREIAPWLIVMGSRRLHGLSSLGSVSRHVVHESSASVLLVAPGER